MSLAALGAAGVGAALSAYQNWSQSSGPLARGSQKLDIGGLRKQLQWQTYYQKRYDEWKSKLDYDYSRQYVQNSAKWQMEGLKNADLNPILAVTNGSMAGTFGSPSSGSIGSGHSGRNPRNSDMSLAASQMAATARQNALLDEQIKQVRAQTRNIDMDTRNKEQTEGLSGTPAALSVLAHKIKDNLGASSAKGRWDVDKVKLGDRWVAVKDKIKNAFSNSSTSHSAKSSDRKSKALEMIAKHPNLFIRPF